MWSGYEWLLSSVSVYRDLACSLGPRGDPKPLNPNLIMNKAPNFTSFFNLLKTYCLPLFVMVARSNYNHGQDQQDTEFM